ncbi:hypothetical protein CDV31_016393 [Fusarium ambrosium]|uniref:RING-type domain-containing protein n=1 Tax=Fusarium ambrosium TaxID=131363 RepID=A0A428S9I6_9HYPO|nr:hypothetical protein CDV31_016393 [Fusarium ambrosium]
MTYFDVYKRCGDCLEELSPGAEWRWRAVRSPFILCDACARIKQAQGNHLIRQYGWEAECAICTMMMPKVYLTCKSGTSSQMGHTFCIDCLKHLDMLDHKGHLANHCSPCPMCRQEVLLAVQSPAELFTMIDDVGEKKMDSHGPQLKKPQLLPWANLQPSQRAINSPPQQATNLRPSHREIYDSRKRRKLHKRRETMNENQCDIGEPSWEVTGVEDVRFIDGCGQVKVTWASTWISIDSMDDGQLKEIAMNQLDSITG